MAKKTLSLSQYEVKRKIDLREVGGISKTVPPSRCISEFTINVPSSYDYRFSSAKREEILRAIKTCYAHLVNKNVAFFYVTSKDMRDFTTTEKDMEAGIMRIPTPNYRTHEEDLITEVSPQEKRAGSTSYLNKRSQSFQKREEIKNGINALA